MQTAFYITTKAPDNALAFLAIIANVLAPVTEVLVFIVPISCPFKIRQGALITQARVATGHESSRPFLLTHPCRFAKSPTATPGKALEEQAAVLCRDGRKG